MTNVYTSNGWDIIVASSQNALNAQLAKLDVMTISQIIPAAASQDASSPPIIVQVVLSSLLRKYLCYLALDAWLT
jgi:hypothetical protein